jgi:hypothetical protein
MTEIYTKSILSTKISLSIVEVGQNIVENLQKKVNMKLSGKCIVEGYVKRNSIVILNNSSGIVRGDTIDYIVVHECKISYPTEGVEIDATVKTITKAGIHAQVIDENGDIPIVVFIARDHHINDKLFDDIKDEGQKIRVRVIGIRFELNDEYICAIAKIIQSPKPQATGISNRASGISNRRRNIN